MAGIQTFLWEVSSATPVGGFPVNASPYYTFPWMASPSISLGGFIISEMGGFLMGNYPVNTADSVF
jgi:hypothetical protein